jgi:hypothetical protein
LHLSGDMRTALLLLALIAPSAAYADARAPQEVALTVGYGTSSVTPGDGGLISLSYERRLSEHWGWLIRPEVVVNLQRPDGRLMKGSALGLDAGAAWQSASEGPRLLGTVTIGGRVFSEPGAGAVSRLELGFGLPVGSFSWAVGVAGEGGLGRIGDERPQTKALWRADLWTRFGARF